MADKPKKTVTPPVVAPEAAANGPTTLAEAELDTVLGGLGESRPQNDGYVVRLGWGFGNGVRAEVEGNY